MRETHSARSKKAVRFRRKLWISAAIIAAALVIKLLPGGAGETVARVVSGGLDYKEAVAAIGRVARGEEDVVAVFRGFAAPKKQPAAPDDAPKQAQPAIDSNFYQTKPEEDKAQPAAAVETAALRAQQTELAEAEQLSFQMSPEELADDTRAEPFRIPPPSYCSYDKVKITFEHVTPVYGTITSKFGYRDHPIGGKASFHTGLDIAAKTGTAVACFADGTVLEAARNDTYGNYVLVEHSGGIRSFYGHNSKLTVKKGQKVKLGQKLAEVGTTGLSTGPHLHFEVRKGTLRLDPKYYISTEQV